MNIRTQNVGRFLRWRGPNFLSRLTLSGFSCSRPNSDIPGTRFQPYHFAASQGKVAAGYPAALRNELNWFLGRLSWPCDLGRPGYGELFPRSSCGQRRSVRADQGLAEPQGAYIPKSTLLVEFRGGGPPGGAADSLAPAAVHYARTGQ